jgi:hypothetical protein
MGQTEWTSLRPYSGYIHSPLCKIHEVWLLHENRCDKPQLQYLALEMFTFYDVSASSPSSPAFETLVSI